MTNLSLNLFRRRLQVILSLVFTLALAPSVFAQYDYGTGSAASNAGGFTSDVTVVSANANMPAGTYNFASFTLNAGDTLTVTGGPAPLIIKCTGTVTIKGVIMIAGYPGTAGQGWNSSTLRAPAGLGGAGGGGGWGAAGGNSADGVNTYTYSPGVNPYDGNNFASFTSAGKGGIRYNGGNTITAGNGAGYGTQGGVAPSTAAPSPGNMNPAASTYGDAALATTATAFSITTNLLGGSGGGGGGPRDQAGATTTIQGGCGGGGGGGAIRITAYNIVLAANSLISVHGGDGGSDPLHAVGAGGGGSGGTIDLQYAQAISGINLGTTPAFVPGTTIDIGGGKGGLATYINNTYYYTIGGDGGQGRFRSIQDPNPPGACTAPGLTAKANSAATSLSVCSGSLSLSANPDANGTGCTNYYEYAWTDGSKYWDGTGFTLATATSAAYSQTFNNITTSQTGSTTVTYTASVQCNASPGCRGTSAVTVTAATQPTAPTTAIASPNASTACSGDNLTLSGQASGGQAGLSCAIEYRYSTDGGANWSSPSTSIPSFAAAAGATKNIIQARRNTCQSGCNGPTGWFVVATWTGISSAVLPTDTVTVSQNKLCKGTAATFTVNYTNGGSTPFFAWYKNGNPVSTDTTSYTDNALNNGDSVWCVMTSSASCATTNLATSNVVHITVFPVKVTSDTITLCHGQSFGGHDSTGVYVDSLLTINGCDSIRTLHLTVLPTYATTVAKTICHGNIFQGHDSTGVYVETFKAQNGCDSVRTLNLTVLQSYATTVTKTICKGHSFMGYDSTGTYVDTYQAANTCDSVRTLHLTVSPNILTILKPIICQGDSYQGHTIAGNYKDTLTASGGCDSIIIIELHVDSIPPVPTITQTGDTLFAPLEYAYYQWFKDDTILIAEGNYPALIISQTGNYTVVVSADSGGCSNHSATFNGIYNGIQNVGTGRSLSVYPNPATDQLTIELSGLSANKNISMRLYNELGQLVTERIPAGNISIKEQLDLKVLAPGLYLLQIQQDNWSASRKVIISK